MKRFAEEYKDLEFVQQVAAQLPWFHIVVLLDKIISIFVLISYLISRFYSEPINRFFRQCLNNRNLKVIN